MPSVMNKLTCKTNASYIIQIPDPPPSHCCDQAIDELETVEHINLCMYIYDY
jgi:hypothetical protein